MFSFLRTAPASNYSKHVWHRNRHIECHHWVDNGSSSSLSLLEGCDGDWLVEYGRSLTFFFLNRVPQRPQKWKALSVDMAAAAQMMKIKVVAALRKLEASNYHKDVWCSSRFFQRRRCAPTLPPPRMRMLFLCLSWIDFLSPTREWY